MEINGTDTSLDDKLAADIYQLALASVASYKKEIVDYAKERTLKNLKLEADLRNAADQKIEKLWGSSLHLDQAQASTADTSVTRLDGYPLGNGSAIISEDGPNAPSSMELVSPLPRYAPLAAISLLTIIKNPMPNRKNRSSKRTGMVPCWLSHASPVPRYDAWVPVNKEFWVGTNLMVEPYIPWFGDEEEKRGNAFELYRRMAKLVKDDTVVSDGELDESGNFRYPPDEEEAWRIYDSASEQRRRASCRAAISAAVAVYDRSNPIVFETLAKALNLGSPQRVAKNA